MALCQENLIYQKVVMGGIGFASCTLLTPVLGQLFKCKIGLGLTAIPLTLS